MKKSYLTTSPGQTQRLGKSLAKEVLKKSPGKAVLIGLEGNLGGGKTTFLQGFAKGLGVKEKINSPTFVILKRFKLRSPKFKNFYHLDCYRIKKPEELRDLGLEEIVANPKNIVAIEWVERARGIIPEEAVSAKFYFVNNLKRKIVITLRHGK